MGSGWEYAAEGEARSRIRPEAGPDRGQAPSLLGVLAAITPAFFLSLSR